MNKCCVMAKAFLRHRLLSQERDYTHDDDDFDHLWYSIVADMDDEKGYSLGFKAETLSSHNSTSSSSSSQRKWRLASGNKEDIAVSCLILVIIVLSLIIIYLWIRSEVTHSKHLRLRRSGSVRDLRLNKDSIYSFDTSPTEIVENSTMDQHPVYLEYKGLQLIGPRFVC